MFAALLGSPALAGPCAPKDMVRVVSFNATPGVDPASPTLKPRTVYRLGALFARIEEAPDPANRAQRLTVIREPDIWIANLFDKKGQHVLDPGPTFEVRAPLFQTRDLPPLFNELELGCELDFVDAYAPTSQGKVTVGGADLVKHQVIIGAQRIEFLLRPAAKGGTRKVHSIGLYVNEQPKSVIRYLTYDIGPANMALFEMPKGVTFVEAPLAAPPPPPPPPKP